MDPNDAHSRMLRAECLRALGRPDEAALGEAQARQLDPNVQPGGPDVGFRFVESAR